MFKFLLFLALFVALYHAAPLQKAANEEDGSTTKKTTAKFVDILESNNELKKDGSYTFSYRSEDGSFREEKAVVADPGSKKEHLEVTGSYSFIDADGEEVVVHYHAGKNGFVPIGSHIPEEISQAAQNAAGLPRVVEDEEDAGQEEEDE